MLVSIPQNNLDSYELIISEMLGHFAGEPGDLRWFQFSFIAFYSSVKDSGSVYVHRTELQRWRSDLLVRVGVLFHTPKKRS